MLCIICRNLVEHIYMDKNLSFFGLLALLCCLVWWAFKVFVIILGCVIICYLIYIIVNRLTETIYFNGKRFKELKGLLEVNTHECNELNKHISELKHRVTDYHSPDFGQSKYQDQSLWKYKRPLLDQLRNNTRNEYFCSLSVCRNAQNQPFKYLCKYFGVVPDKPTLELFESMFNDFSAADDGKKILLQERQEILVKYKDLIPYIIRKFKIDLLFKKLGYMDVDISDRNIPKFSFIYVSAAGNSSITCDIILDCSNLERLIAYINSQIQLSSTISYQRALMTKSLRKEIMLRDNYTCQVCGISIKDEPHLLLEIDHIVPLSRGGVTSLNNLQTLCWRCNRKKGAKLM